MPEFDYKAYWNERLTGNFGLDAVGYIGLGKNFNHYMYRLRKDVFLRHVRPLPVNFAQASALDVGSGTGFYIDLWKRLGVRQLQGADISRQAVLNLRRRYPDNSFQELDVGSEPLPENTFDLISCMDILFHVVDDDKFSFALQSMSRALKKGGYLIITDNFLHGQTKRLAHHVSRSLEMYNHALGHAGLKCVLRRPAFFFLNFPLDSDSRVLNFVWAMLLKYIPGHEIRGSIAGMLLYFLDRVLVRLLKEGPTTEIVVCEKSS